MYQKYLERNLIHCKSVGVRAGIEAALNRVLSWSRPPQWLVELLQRDLIKAGEVSQEMARHRDELRYTVPHFRD